MMETTSEDIDLFGDFDLFGDISTEEPERIPTLHECIRFLADRCDGARTIDGQGFNKLDTFRGLRLAQTPPDGWTGWDKLWAFKRVRKYHGQLEEGGIAWEKVPEPQFDASPFREIKIDEDAEHFIIAWGHMEKDDFVAVRAAANKIPGIWWIYRHNERASVPFDSVAARALRDFAKDWQFDYEADVEQKFFELIDRSALLYEWAQAVTAPDYDLGPAEITAVDGKSAWPHQRSGVRYLEAVKWRAIIGDEMGSGKSATALLAAVKANAFPLLIVCPASVKYGWEQNVKNWLPDKTVAVLNGGGLQSVKADVLIANYDIFRVKMGSPNPLFSLILAKASEGLIRGVIADECFPYETPVLTDKGWINIGDIVENGLDVKVASRSGSHLTWKRITRWVKNPSGGSMVRISHGSGDVVCTANHKVWTEEDGFVRADQISKRHHLRILRKGVPRKEPSNTILRKVMLGQMENADPSRASENVPNKDCARQGEKESSRVSVVGGIQCLTDSRRKDASRRQEARKVMGGSARRQRQLNEASDDVVGVDRVADGVLYTDIASERQILFSPSRLLGGLGSPGFDDSNRDRWELASNEEVEVPGQEEDGGLVSVRVDNVEILERGSSGFAGVAGGTPDYVYNLEVEQTHNYIANGVLVSNCHMLKSKESGRTRAMKQLYDTAQKGIFFRLHMSGTPIMNRVSEFIPNLELTGLLDHFGGVHQFMRLYNIKYANLRQMFQKLCEAGYLIRMKEDHVIDPDGKLLPLTSAPRDVVSEEFFDWYKAQPKTPEVIDYVTTELRKRDYIFKPGAMDLPSKTIQAVPVDMQDPARYGWAHNRALEYLRELVDQYGDPSAWERWQRALFLVHLIKLRNELGRQKFQASRQWVEEFLENTDEKLIIVVWHKAMVDMFTRYFKGAAHIVGGQSLREREENRKRFAHDPDCKLMVMQILSGGQGIDELQFQCSNIAFMELGWNPAQHKQAEDRLHRGGQTRNVTVHYLIAKGVPNVAPKTLDNYLISIIDNKKEYVTPALHGGSVPEEEQIGGLVGMLFEDA